MMWRFRSGNLWERSQRLSAHNIDHHRRPCSRLAFHSVSKDSAESLTEPQQGGLGVPDDGKPIQRFVVGRKSTFRQVPSPTTIANRAKHSVRIVETKS